MELKGHSASPGMCKAKVNILNQHLSYQASGDAQEEHARLNQALTKASTDIAALISRVENTDAAYLLEFQLSILDEESIVTPAFAKIESGVNAYSAWDEVLSQEEAVYSEEDNDYFAARALDITDIKMRVLRNLVGIDGAELLGNAINVADDLLPSLFLNTRWTSGGIALTEGSVNSHLAILARSYGVPMIVGMESITGLLSSEMGLLDANNGILVINPTPPLVREFDQRFRDYQEYEQEQKRFREQTLYTDRGERLRIYINLADLHELNDLDPAICDGVGLVRTEFLFHDGDLLATEELQFKTYRKILQWAKGKPVVIRLLDIGGDKPITGVTVDEKNPYLGTRGIRLLLKRIDILRVQLKAILRASAYGQLRILVPMVTVPEEMAAVRSLLKELSSELQNAGVKHEIPALGMMVEVPSAAICLDQFDSDFYGIGTNDLVQYVTACSRESDSLAELGTADNPAVLSLIKSVNALGKKQGKEVCICGNMGGDPRYAATLMAAGLLSLSIGISEISPVKTAINSYFKNRKN